VSALARENSPPSCPGSVVKSALCFLLNVLERDLTSELELAKQGKK